MSGRAPARPYDLLARYYDEVMVEHAGLFRRVRRSLLRPILPQVESMCDLGSGSGETALEFARRGRRVYAVDLSPGQVRAVRRKARREKLPIRALQADMRTFRLPAAVDLVTSEFDVLNHLPRRSDLQRVARAVFRALRPGGWFYFDVNTRKAFERLWSSASWAEAKDFAVVQHGRYDRARRRAILMHEWFLREGRRWRKRSERLEEVCWSRREIREALRGAGFVQVQVWDGAPFFRGWDWEEPGCRIFFLARRPSAVRDAPRRRARTAQ